jgi:hypothetical protein
MDKLYYFYGKESEREEYGKCYGEERKISIAKKILKRTSKKSVYSYH